MSEHAEHTDDMKKLSQRELLLLTCQKLDTLSGRFESLEKAYQAKIVELEIRVKSLEVKAAIWGAGSAIVVTLIIKILMG